MEPNGPSAPGPPDPAAGGPGRSRRRVLLLRLSFVALLGAAVWLVARPRGAEPVPDNNPSADEVPADPRLAYRGPYVNVRPGVRYVGDRACAGCHPDQAETYRHHPMGRSLAPVGQVAPHQVYDKDHGNPFQALGYTLRVDRDGEEVWHRVIRPDGSGKPAYELALPVHYAIGSGRRGFSYLTNHDGYLFQTPISWFSQKKTWDKSPGFTARLHTGRPIPTDCLFCHANQVEGREGYRNRFAEPVFRGLAIGCERCHGPGELHVAARAKSRPEAEIDPTIVNPRRLAYHLRQAVCEQCHLAGATQVVRRGRKHFDFRPGLAVEDILAVFVHAGGGRKAVSHVEQMYQSRCFRGSSGRRKLKCVSCHDPHAAAPGDPGRRLTYYRNRCLRCHGDRPGHAGPERMGPACAEKPARRRAKKDDCADCHMHRFESADIAHTAATDHRIPRRPAKPGAEEPPGDLVNFYQDRLDPRDPGNDRDLGVGLVRAAFGVGPDLREHYASRAVALLEEALAGSPDDPDAWEAQGMALMMLHRLPEAVTAFDTALAKAPVRESALYGAGLAAIQLRRPDLEAKYWGRAVAVNPWMPDYRERLALVREYQKDWRGAEEQCRAWLRLDPVSVEAHQLWARCLLRAGKKAEAEKEIETLKRLAPSRAPAGKR